MSKHGQMEGKVRGRVVRDRSVTSSKGYEKEDCVHVGKEVKRGSRNSVLQTLMCGSKTWTWNRAQQSEVCAVERSYLRGACAVTRGDGESNKSVYKRCAIGSQANEVKSGVMEWVRKKYFEI